MDTKRRLLYMLFTRDTPQNKGHIQTASKGLEKYISHKWRRKWQPTPVFLPRESQGWGSLVGCHLWGGTESDMLKDKNWCRTNWSDNLGRYWGAPIVSS